MKPLILASTSPYRKELLSRFGLPFEAVAPDYDETEGEGLPPAELALLHARGKALSLSGRFPDRVIIGSDQTAELDGVLIGKPGSAEGAVLQLSMMSGRKVVFHTGLAVVADGKIEAVTERFEVTLRRLTPAEIGAYVEAEMPVGCAGSFMIEGLGIALMEGLSGRDYTSLIGLPLIALTGLMRNAGVDVLSPGIRNARSSCR